MDMLAQLRKILGLADTADADAICAKVKTMQGGTAMQSQIAVAVGLAETAEAELVLNAVKALKAAPTLQSVLAPIAKAAGLNDNADAAAIVSAVAVLATAKGAEGATIVALQSEVKELGTKLSAALTQSATDRATAFVDGAIKLGHVGVKPLREHYIAMHAADPARVEKEINALPKVGPGATIITPPASPDGKPVLSSEQAAAAKVLGIKPEDYLKTLAAEQAQATH